MVSGEYDFRQKVYNMTKLQLVIKSVDKTLGFRQGVRKKEALSQENIHKLVKLRIIVEADEGKDDLVRCTLAMFILSFWAGLRSDNVVIKGSFDKDRHLNWSSLNYESDGSVVGSLKKHKTANSLKAPIIFSFLDLGQSIYSPVRILWDRKSRMDLKDEDPCVYTGTGKGEYSSHTRSTDRY